jgi:Xaa-Pro aminopeptidase
LYGRQARCRVSVRRRNGSRLVSLDRPMEIKTGMVFALETYCPAADGYSAARIEEEVVVTDTGCRVISLFPAEELPIANRY